MFEIRFEISRSDSAWIIVLENGRQLQFPIAMKRDVVLSLVEILTRSREKSI